MAGPPRTPTLADVAARAGVSTATVSRCLNAPERVVGPTRERVLEAVRALGYSPNFGARALAAKRTNTIGAVIPSLGNSMYAGGIQAFQDVLAEQGFTLLLAASGWDAQQEETQIRALVARGADGLLLIGDDRDPAIYDFLALHGVPALTSWAFPAAPGRTAVGIDNRAAMRGLAETVLAAGHRRLGAIMAPSGGNDRITARLCGIHDAMRATGLNPDDLQVIETPYGLETGSRAFARMMTRTPRPTAILCANDVLAVGALRQARRMGIAVPEAVSITGFNDMELALIADPPLTTLRVPHADMGRLAAQALVVMVRDGDTPASVEVPTEVCLRQSLAPPPPD